MAKDQTEKAFLSGAGEFGTLSELLKRNLNAHITLGNTKAMDILVSYPDGAWKSIEVKTSRTTRFVTDYWQKYYDETREHPDYWVIVHIDTDNISHYYILSHDELGVIQAERNGRTVEECRMGCCSKGCDNVLRTHIADYENMWDKIIERQ